MPGPVDGRAGKSRRRDAAHRRPWQYRNDEGSPDPRTLYRAHHFGCAGHRLPGACGYTPGEWSAGGCRAHHAGADGTCEARPDDGTFPAGERGVMRRHLGNLPLALLLAAAPAFAKPEAKPKHVNVTVPSPRPPLRGPEQDAKPAADPAIDLSQALPGKAMAKLPS